MITGLVSILEGMAVTLSWLFRRPYTVQWPDKLEKPLEEALPERYRGLLEVDVRLCMACGSCERSCPIGCIAMSMDKDPVTKERFITGFQINASKCMYCGLCVEACPTQAIQHTRVFAASHAELGDLVLRFMAPGEKASPFKPKDPRPEARPAGSITRSVMKPCFKEEESSRG
jgi:formate hydrogenlyase subunit 6/NADH:ubiquinone oxidoreductase subunit I